MEREINRVNSKSYQAKALKFERKKALAREHFWFNDYSGRAQQPTCGCTKGRQSTVQQAGRGVDTAVS